nr:MAG TPA: hypothetical protein [Caudoviricetes sp.]
MKRRKPYREITSFRVKLALLLLLAILPLSGRACDMAIVPNTKVRLAENIRDVLNSAGGSVTDDIVTFFQDRAKINI